MKNKSFSVTAISTGISIESATYALENAYMRPEVSDYAGFIAFTPDGYYFAHSRSILELENILKLKLPDVEKDYQEILDEGGDWFFFLEHLFVYGLQVYLSTNCIIDKLDSGSEPEDFQFCPMTRRIWRSGENPPARSISIDELNLYLSNKIRDDATKQNFGGLI